MIFHIIYELLLGVEIFFFFFGTCACNGKGLAQKDVDRSTNTRYKCLARDR